jgi:hypothetical protein
MAPDLFKKDKPGSAVRFLEQTGGPAAAARCRSLVAFQFERRGPGPPARFTRKEVMHLIKLGNAVIVAEHVVAVEKRGLGDDWALHLDNGRHHDCAAKECGTMEDFLSKLEAATAPKLPARKAKP